VPDPDQAGVPRGQVKLLDASARKVLRWAVLDKDDTNEATDYRFYWEDWADSVPVCQTVDDVFLLCGTLLNYSGVKIGQEPPSQTGANRQGVSCR
jgi:THO complex subunit 2